jgi:CHAD domain-containing protein
MADEKWIPDLHGNMPASEAARRVLAIRLGVVRERLPDAVLRADDDIEHVHQLRVGTRRAGAALRIFASLLPPRLYNKTRKSLRKLRRSAGEARDWDVFLDALQTRVDKSATKQRRGLIFLLGFAHGQRVLAQQHLNEAYEAKGEEFNQHVDQLLETLAAAEPSQQTLRDLAAPMLTQLVQELVATARGDLQQYEVLHQVRIFGKQLRYAMEIFESCYDDSLRKQYYPAIVEMQDILGLANDSVVACQRLNDLRARLMRTQPKQWPQYQDGIESLLRIHERQLPRQRKQFEDWWRDWMASGTEEAFAKLVSG